MLDKLQGLNLSLCCLQRLEAPEHIPDNLFSILKSLGATLDVTLTRVGRRPLDKLMNVLGIHLHPSLLKQVCKHPPPLLGQELSVLDQVMVEHMLQGTRYFRKKEQKHLSFWNYLS